MPPTLTKNPETSCRPDQLFGFWAIEETRFRRMLEVVQASDLDKLRAESRTAAADAAGRPLYRSTSDGIAVIDVSGPLTKYPTSFQALLGGTSMLRTREALRAAARDPEVRGVMVVIDSPGGSVAGTADLADELRQANKRKPVYTYAEDFAGSGALWILTQGRKAFANSTAEVGSMGAYLVVEDTSGVFAKEQVKVHVIRSAEFKGAGMRGTEVTPTQLEEWQRRIDDVAGVFVSQVASGRGLSQEAADALHTGQMWVADKAREHGLIDDVVSLDEAMRRLRSEAMSEQEITAARAATAEAEQRAKAEGERALKAEGEVSDLKKRLEALESEKRKSRFAAEAKELGVPEAFADVLDAIEAKCGADVHGKVLERLRAAAAQVETGELFSEKGSAVPSKGTSAAEQVLAKANELVKAGKAKTVEQATTLVLRTDADLAKRYVEERN